jgi:hypothetical protein
MRALRLRGFAPNVATTLTATRELVDHIGFIFFGQIESNSAVDSNVDERKEEVGQQVISLFESMTEQGELYSLVGDHSSFWDQVARDWNTVMPSEPQDARLVATAYITSRQAYGPASIEVSTPVTTAVDNWLETVKQYEVVKSLRTLTLSSKPLPTAVDSLVATLRGLVISGPTAAWPPQHFTAADVALISDRAIRELVHGVTPENQQQMPALPTSLSTPLSTKLFLVWTALTETTVSSTFKLFPAPLCNLTGSQRHHWRDTLNGQARAYGTIGNFVDFAKSAFADESKTMVVGVITPWFGPAYGQLNAMASSQPPGASVDRLALWNANCPRLGMALVVGRTRTIDEANPWAYAMILYDPLRLDNALVEEWYIKSNMHHVMQFRGELCQQVAAAFNIRQGWWGGIPVTVRDDRRGDGVEMACLWAHRVVSYKGDDAWPQTEEEWGQTGFTGMQSLRGSQ